MQIFQILIPFLSAGLFLAGGQGFGWARGLIGIPIGIFFAFHLQSWIPLICCVTFLQQPPYGEHSYLNFLGEYGKFAVVGFVFGISSLPIWIVGGLWWVGVIQGIVSMCAYVCIKYLDDRDVVKNPFVELLRGLCGTLLTAVR